MAPAQPNFIDLTPASNPDVIASARALLLDYGRFVVSNPAAARFCLASLEEEAANLPGSYSDIGGGSLLALMNDLPSGFVAWRPAPGLLADHSWELKRLWIVPQTRGSGLGRALTQAVLDRAQTAERNAVYLDTLPSAMPAAHRLYLDMGFTPCAAYNDNPIPDLAYLVKHLV
ncbi:GNAT family N-acetyltransferase [Occallatibacter riparius]|uniref:GNAT family N-acetyltransferase n=1 Tax=Occallatibacter riparius TaxID=1002689 RepID=A0A9J7BG77_9BACT|nr:GNAT family N-acetyltransferase [Occallatibacter riparius]UWZ81759.1 GNAT family N-acetyltransferase [Occallatibacter riparius]